LAVLAVSDQSARAQLELCIKLGVPAVLVIGTPFAGRNDGLLSELEAAGVTVQGPNCMGLAVLATELDLSPSLFNPGEWQPGRVAVVSQSGTVGTDLVRQLCEHRLGVSAFFSVGDQYQLPVAEYIDWVADEANTEGIIVYIEDPIDGSRFLRSLRNARERGQSVVVIGAGWSADGRRAVTSHSGALATDRRVLRALCRENQCLLADHAGEAVELVEAELRRFRSRGRRVGIVSEGGGHGALATDLLSDLGLSVPPLSPGVRQQLQTALNSPREMDNPVDLPDTRESSTVYGTAIACLLESGEVDQVLIAGSFGDLGALNPERPDAGEYLEGEWATARSIVELQRSTGRPVVVQSFYPDSAISRWMVEECGSVVVRQLADAVRALAASAPPMPAGGSVPGVVGSGGDGKAGQDHRHLGYLASRDILLAAGVPLCRCHLVRDTSELTVRFRDLGGPVVLKALDRLHKSEQGGVRTGIVRLDEAKRQFGELQASRPASDIVIESDESWPGAIELLVGARRTHRYGVVALLGEGGVLAETIDDVAVMSYPLTQEKFDRSVSSLRIAHQFVDGRSPALPLRAVRNVVHALTDMLIDDEELTEIEVNPLLCRPDGVIGVDARVTTSGVDDRAL
jgi:acyl-CoA synthetase (NDP forming)